MSDSVYITTPIYYVNDKPHIGHAYTTLAADVLARFYRMAGRPVKFLTGTDEHGQKVEKSAAHAGLSPQAFVDQVSQTFRDLTQKLQATNDDFIRTTEPRHQKAVAHLWQTLIDKDEIYLGSYEGWYAVRDEAFYAESELIDGKAPTGAEVEWVTESCYFFRLSKWQQPLLDFYQQNPNFIAPESRRNEVIRFVEGGLHDLCVSRTTFQWGIHPPQAPDHVIYVWLDALTNYISALGYPNTTLGSDFATFWPGSLHIIGKDILRFHAVYWPAFLMAAELPLPKRLFVHGWWTNQGEKISKSLGNTIDPIELIEKFGCDPVRYFLMREVPFGQDGDFSEHALIMRLNADLANNYGNLVHRVLSFIQKFCGGRVPEIQDPTPEDEQLLRHAHDIRDTLHHFMDQQALHKYAERVWQLISEANKYIDAQKPWALKTSNPQRMGTILAVLVHTLHRLAFYTHPLIPDISDQILDLLAIPKALRTFQGLDSPPPAGCPLPIPESVCPRWDPVP